LFRKSTVSAAPLFFGLVDVSLNGLSKNASLLLSTSVDDGLLAGGQDRSIGSGLGEMLHLLKKCRVIPKQRLEVIVDLDCDRLP
jgi:hypothetical protein